MATGEALADRLERWVESLRTPSVRAEHSENAIRVLVDGREAFSARESDDALFGVFHRPAAEGDGIGRPDFDNQKWVGDEARIESEADLEVVIRWLGERIHV